MKKFICRKRSVMMYPEISKDMSRSTHSITVCTSLFTCGGDQIYLGQLNMFIPVLVRVCKKLYTFKD